MIKNLSYLILLFLASFYSCEQANDKKVVKFTDNGWRLEYIGEILVDSAQFRVKDSVFDGKRYFFDHNGELKSFSWYHNGVKRGLTILPPVNGLSEYIWYKEGKKRGPNYLKRKDGWITEYHYNVDDTLVFSSTIDRDSGITIKKGRVFTHAYDDKRDTMNIGDTLSLNVFMIPVPHSLVGYCFLRSDDNKDKKECFVVDSISVPLAHSFILNEEGNFNSVFYFSITDTLSGKKIDEFKIGVDYIVE